MNLNTGNKSLLKLYISHWVKYPNGYFLFRPLILFIVLAFSILFYTGCKNEINVSEEKHSVNQNKHDKYQNDLFKAKLSKNKYKESVAMANLNYDSELVFRVLQEAVEENDSFCYEILEYERLYNQHGFKIVFIKSDFTKWQEVCQNCHNLISDIQLEDYKSDKLTKYKEKRKKIKIDSSKLDFSLIAILDSVLIRDQMYRGHDIKNKWLLQDSLDKINIKIIDSILNNYGYPNKDKIGIDHLLTPWLVLHHIPDKELRLKYRFFIANAVKNNRLNRNLLKNFDDRTGS